MLNMGHFIQAPRLWPAHPAKERRVTWMELFFDLIFVAAVAQVGKPLSADYSLPGLLRYSFLFVLIWLAWSGHTLYSTRFDTDDLVQRLLILVQSFIAAVMAANAKDALDSTDAAGFGAAYAGMRIVLALQYLRARRVRETRPLTTRYAIGFGCAAVIWIASALAPVPERYWLWIAALAVDFSVPWLAAKHSVNYPPDAAHFPERFGLFTIILIGEFVAAVMHGIESQETWPVAAAFTAFSSMAFAFALWWWYFDGAQSSAERHIRTKRQAALFQVWNYAHLPLFLGIGVAGAGFEHAIALRAGETLHHSAAAILCTAVAVLMLALMTIGATSEAVQKRRALTKHLWPQCVALALVVLLGVFADHVPPVALVTGLLLCCAAQAVLAQRETLTHPTRHPTTLVGA
jgi:low temperature requirement protein LtrA